MAVDFNKYIFSTGTHYIANSGSDERGQYSGGTAGDQTGKEWQLKAWYNRPWTVVLRYPDQAVAQVIAELGIEGALNNKIGYDQTQRTTYWTQLQKANYRAANITVACEEDCTAGVTANVKAAGYLCNVPALQSIRIDTYSGNMRSRFVKAGFTALTASKYLTSGNYLLPGDILLYEGHHAATNITCGHQVLSDWHPKKSNSTVPTIRTLSKGMAGEDVKTLQKRLMMLGYKLPKYGADGDFGEETDKAVREFQKDQGLVVDGVVGTDTLAAISKALRNQNDNNAVDKLTSYVAVRHGNYYVRKEPDKSSESFDVVHDGDKIFYLGETKNGWNKVLVGGKEGWLSTKAGDVVKIESKVVKVKDGNWYIRKEPDAKSTQLGTVHGGEEVRTLEGATLSWVPIIFNGGIGYITKRAVV